MPRSSIKRGKLGLKGLWKLAVRAALKTLKTVLHGPLFRDLLGRLTVLLQILVQLTGFVIVVYRLAADAAWWRSNALADSYTPCRSSEATTDTLQLCAAFVSDLESLLQAFATAVAALSLKLCTSTGAMCCSKYLATSTRLDRGNWFDDKNLRKAVGRFRHSKASRLSFSKPCQWRAAAMACSVWATCLLCDLVTFGSVGWYTLGFKSQISEYSEELFPETQDQHSWGSIWVTVGTLLGLLLIDTVMLASAALKLHDLSKIKDKWEYASSTESADDVDDAEDNDDINDTDEESQAGLLAPEKQGQTVELKELKRRD